ncbi:accessory gland protein Acp29AB-like [Drosophila subpulchrella]|uniref:accessory gland protein Acp29AB-like n=1 Tax=Drosophila subpulchrella TaxID=1486046 RepID=UPI0018A15F93|nr:accessory gland protein Acp29AB-like [Drosophila subpulchrella]
MLKFGKYFWIAFLVSNLYGESMSKDTCSFCVLKDAPSQCATFCLSALHPLFDHNTKYQHKMNNLADTLSNSNAKLDKIEGQMQSLQNSVETLKTSMEEILHKINNHTCDSRLEENQLTDSHKTVSGTNDKIILPVFKQIGSRSFYIERRVTQDWTTAEKTCRQKGGHLASIKNEEEFTAITGKLDQSWYWIGINDREKEGEYVSVASGKPAPFLKWGWFRYSNGNVRDCVRLSKNGLLDSFCNETYFFICQQDNEI